MHRAVVTARGRIQKVGYRDIVTEMANNMDITGTAENLPDGKSVKIIAEADKNVLEEFIQLLWVKDDPTIKVIHIDSTFQPSTGEFEFFNVLYYDFQEEVCEWIEVLALYLRRLYVRQKTMLEKWDRIAQMD